jgi:hypothetical protein
MSQKDPNRYDKLSTEQLEDMLRQAGLSEREPQLIQEELTKRYMEDLLKRPKVAPAQPIVGSPETKQPQLKQPSPSTTTYTPATVAAQPNSQPLVQQNRKVDPKSGIKIVAGIVEIIAGWFGFLGVGHYMLGDSNGGKKKMGQWAIAIIVALVISIVSGGAAFALALPIWFAVPIVSGLLLMIKNDNK